MISTLSKQSKYTTISKSKRTSPISKVTIHHAAAISDAETIAKHFSNPLTQASANYIIGTNGEIIALVPEEYRAWTSSNRANDMAAITIEVCNSSTAPEWMISEASMSSLIKLCADICNRYNIKPYFSGNKNGTFTFHYMFSKTECPGAYIRSRIDDIIDAVIAAMSNSEGGKTESGDFKVKVTANTLNIRKSPSSKSEITGKITDKGVYTIVSVSGNWGKLKSGKGWISLKYTKEV